MPPNVLRQPQPSAAREPKTPASAASKSWAVGCTQVLGRTCYCAETVTLTPRLCSTFSTVS